jgi:hypothetical protein
LIEERLMVEEKKKDEKPVDPEPKAGGTDLAEKPKPSTEVSTDLSSDEDDFFADAGEGLQDFSQTDYLIPYVRIIQALSKELQKNHAKFLKGAEQGMFVNSATRKLYEGEKTGFLAVPVSFNHRYMAWLPNNAGPAYDMGDDPSKFNATEPVAEGKEKGKKFDEDGNQLTDALQFFIMLVNKETDEFEVAVLNFTGSQARKGRGWVSTIGNRMERRNGQLMRPAIYFYSYDITTVPESNDQGSWYGFLISEGPKVKDLPNGREIFTTAKQLRERIKAGEVKAAVEEPDADAEAGEEKAF